MKFQPHSVRRKAKRAHDLMQNKSLSELAVKFNCNNKNIAHSNHDWESTVSSSWSAFRTHTHMKKETNCTNRNVARRLKSGQTNWIVNGFLLLPVYTKVLIRQQINTFATWMMIPNFRVLTVRLHTCANNWTHYDDDGDGVTGKTNEQRWCVFKWSSNQSMMIKIWSIHVHFNLSIFVFLKGTCVIVFSMGVFDIHKQVKTTWLIRSDDDDDDDDSIGKCGCKSDRKWSKQEQTEHTNFHFQVNFAPTI